MAQSGSAPALGAGSRRFKSSRPDHINLILVNHLMVTLYVLKGKSGKRYVGMTNDLARHLREHRSKRSKGGQLIDAFIVLHSEEFPDYKTARGRETFLKSGQGRKWLDEFEVRSESAKGG